MKKRLIICVLHCIISALCALCLVACGGDGKGNDNGEVTVDGIVYSLNADKTSYTLKKTKNPTTDTSLVIASEIKGKPVTAIASYAIDSAHNHFTSITVPDSVTDIQYMAFRYCTEIESITLPFVGSTDSSGRKDDYFYSAFAKEEDFLEEFTKLKKVTVTCETGINDYAFYRCANLEEIILPDTLTKISDFAFYGCINLKEIDIPQSVTYIGKEAFRRCESLKSVVIPDSVTEIANGAFMYCSRLRKVTLGRSVAIIDYNAFNCGKIVEVCNLSSLEIKKGDYYENGMIGKDLQHLYGEEGQSRINVSDDGYVFVSNPDNNKYFLIDYEGSETELVLHKYVGMNYKVWTRAFESSSGVTKITVPEDLSIDSYAFLGMKDLREVVILAEIDSINGMFEDCESLTTVTLPASVDHFGWEPFKNCNKLKDIYYGGTMEAWNSIYKSADNWKVSDTVIVHCSDGNLDRDGNQI